MENYYDNHKPEEQGSVAEDFMINKGTRHNAYRFNDSKDEKGKQQHLHQLWSERKEEYENVTGATTIIDVLGKVLTWWASGKAMEVMGWTNGKLKVDGKYQTIPLERRLTHLKPIREAQSKLSDTEYLSVLDEAYKAHSVFLDKSADAGTDMHQLMEDYVKACIKTNGRPALYLVGDNENLLAFSKWAVQNVKRFLWSEAYCYDEMLFVGGITDVGAEMKDGSYAIIDFKSAKEAYFNHFVQIAIYNLLIERNGLVDKHGNDLHILEIGERQKITKYFVIPFGASKFTVVENDKVKGLKEAGLACVKLYREKSLFENN